MNMKYKLCGMLVACVAGSFMSSCNNDDPAFGSTCDIKWPVVAIAAISPADSATVSSNLIITGTGLDKVMSITIDNRTMTVVDKTATTLTATLPRKFNSSAITFTNLYRQTVKSAKSIAPKYPAIQIVGFPDQITKGQAIVITGTNLDLVTSVLVGSNVVAVSSTNATTLTIQTTGLKINVGDKVVVEVKSNYSKLVNSKSLELEVVE